MCIVARRIRISQLCLEDIFVDLVPGDVMAFNQSVGHSGWKNAPGSAILCVYLDISKFDLDYERNGGRGDMRRFGFAVMVGGDRLAAMCAATLPGDAEPV